MSVPCIPEPARIIVSVLTAQADLVPIVTDRLRAGIGALDESIGPLSFHYTNYYEPEMGPGIRRWLLSFADPLDRAQLMALKLFSNELEAELERDGKRTVNLDPGIMTLSNFVLATGKENAHRIYLGYGIFADLTLIYQRGSYRPLPWTYPDWGSQEMMGILNRLREQYKCALRQTRPRADP